MRKTCPLCGRKPIDTLVMDYAIPDGWTLPSHFNWHLCDCGFIWADTPGTSADFDQFYRDHYDPLIDVHDIHRMKHMALFVYGFVDRNARIVDFGGGDGYITQILKVLGCKNVVTVNLDDEMPECDVVVSSQVIEHLYDLDGNMKRITDKLVDGGLVINEMPEAYEYSKRTEPPLLDYYPTHCNHFTMRTLSALFSKYGYELIHEERNLEYAATNAPMFRTVFQKNGHKHLFDRVKAEIAKLEPVVVDEPVIVFGLGDIALYKIANSDIDVKYYVDESPIYKGASINGVPVRDKVDGSACPVLVMGRRQREAVTRRIKETSDNRIIWR